MLIRRVLPLLLVLALGLAVACEKEEQQPALKADGKPQPPVVLEITSESELERGGRVDLELHVKPEVDAEDFYVTWQIPEDVKPVDAKGETRHLIKRNETASFVATIDVPDSLPRQVTANVMFKTPDGSMFGDTATIHLGRPRTLHPTPTPLLLYQDDGNTADAPPLAEQKGTTRVNSQPVE